MLKQPVQNLAGGSGLMRNRKGRLHLTQNLWFAEHHGIQSRSDSKGMLNGLFAGQRISRTVEDIGGEIAVIPEPVKHRGAGRIFLATVDFGTVTR